MYVLYLFCKLTKLECVKLVVEAGGADLLAFQDKENDVFEDWGNTILHYASERKEPDFKVAVQNGTFESLQFKSVYSD